MVPHLVHRRLHFVHVGDHAMCRVAHLSEQAAHPFHRGHHGTQVVAHREHVGCAVLHELKVLLDRNRFGADLERYRCVLDRTAQRAGDALHHRDSRRAKDVLGNPIQDDHVTAVTHVVIALDHEDVGIHCRGAEMALRGGVSDVRWQVAGDVEAVVVADLHARHDEDADDGDGQRDREHGAGPTHGSGADPPPSVDLDGPFRIEQTESAGDGDHGRRGGERAGDDDEQPQRGRDAQRLEIRQARQMKAEGGPGDRQSRAQDDMNGPAEHRVIGGFPILTGVARLLVSTDQKDRVIGTRRDRQRGQHGDDERGEPQQTVVAEERDKPSGGAHFETDHDENQKHRADGTVGDEQHDHDDHAGHAHHHEHAFVGGFVHVRRQRRRAGDIDVEPWGPRQIADDVPHGLDGLVSPGAALVAGQIELDVGGFAVPALDTGGREWIAPHVLDVLRVLGIGLQLCHQAVVVAAGFVAECPVTVQDDHRGAVGIGLVEGGADALGGDHRRRVLR